jgi:membrane associated rhomboid family serine protease
MNRELNFFDNIKYQFNHGGMTIRLIMINVAIFLMIALLNLLSKLFGYDINLLIENIFALNTDISILITHPWGLITTMFSHFGFFHLLMNMLMLYFTGKMFEQFFSSKKLLNIYLLGGLAGGILEVNARLIFPALAQGNVHVVGASGSIMAIFMAIAFYRPQMKVMLFGIVPVSLIILAFGFLAMDLFALSSKDNTAHFAHIGGSLIGILYVKTMYKPNNILDKFTNFTDKLFNFITKFEFKKKTKLKVEYGNPTSIKYQSDEEFNLNKKKQQEQTDKILDKIAKSGYESLSKSEKDFLFHQSKK